MFIRSERLFLRPGWPEDWAELLAAIGDEDRAANFAYPAENARSCVLRPQERMLPHFLVTLPSKHGARLIGSAGLHGDEDGAALAYWIARPYWGQGYATEAVRAVLSLARAIGHRKVIAYHFADNPASDRVLRKTGFVPTGSVSMRPSMACGEPSPAQRYAADLAVGGGDDDGDMRRAA